MNATSKLLLIVVSAGALSLSACSSNAPSAERDDSGEIVADGEVDAFSLHVGDCYNDDQSLAEDADVSSVGAVPCNSPHDNEIFALVTAHSATGAYPGDDAIFVDNVDACEQHFARYVGIEYSASVLGMGPLLVPSPETWLVGDREVVCAAFNGDRTKLTESVKDAGDSVRADGIAADGSPVDESPADGSPADGSPADDTTTADTTTPSVATSGDVAAFCDEADAFADEYAAVLADPASGDINALVARSQALTVRATEIIAAQPAESAAVTACLEKMTAAISGI